MDIQKFLADTVVDIISEKDIAVGSVEKKNYKRGFFLENPYFQGKTTLKNNKTLITEEYLNEIIKQGKKNIGIPENSIITPSARILIEEGRIKVSD